VDYASTLLQQSRGIGLQEGKETEGYIYKSCCVVYVTLHDTNDKEQQIKGDDKPSHVDKVPRHQLPVDGHQ